MTRKNKGAAKNTACHTTTGTPRIAGITAGAPDVRAAPGKDHRGAAMARAFVETAMAAAPLLMVALRGS
jgi:hypothetical protein